MQRLACAAVGRVSPWPRHAIRDSAGTVRPYTLLDTPVRRTLKIRFRLVTVALAGMVVGAIAGYMLLTVTILRWSMP